MKKRRYRVAGESYEEKKVQSSWRAEKNLQSEPFFIFGIPVFDLIVLFFLMTATLNYRVLQLRGEYNYKSKLCCLVQEIKFSRGLKFIQRPISYLKLHAF